MATSKLQLIIDLKNKMFNSKLMQTQESFNKASNNLMGKASKLKMENAKAFSAMTDQFPAISRGMDLLSNKYVLLAGAAAGIGLLAGKAIKVGIEDEMQRTSFEVMLGGKKAATGLVNEIADYAKKTPYEKLGLGDAAKMMLGFGIAQEKVMPNLKMLGDIAMGDANKMSSLTRAFSQMSSAGTANMEDINQMIDAGFNPLSEISKKTGLSIGELREKVSKGAISFQMIEGAFKSATSEGGKYNGMADKMSKTFGGKLSSLVDSFKTSLLGLYNVLQPILIPAIDFLTTTIEGIVPAFQWVAQQFTNGNPIIWGLAIAVGGVVTAILVYNIYSKIAAFRTAWLAKNTAIQIALDKAMKVGTYAKTVAMWAFNTAGKAVSTMMSRQKMLTVAQNALNWIVRGSIIAWTVAQKALNFALKNNPIGWILTLIGLLVGAIIWVISNWDLFVAGWKTGWITIKTMAKMGWNSLKTSLGVIGIEIKILWLKFKSFGEWIGGFFKNIGKAIKLALDFDFSGAKKALFAPIHTQADKEIAHLKKQKDKLWNDGNKEQIRLFADAGTEINKVWNDYKKKKSNAEKQQKKMAENANVAKGKGNGKGEEENGLYDSLLTGDGKGGGETKTNGNGGGSSPNEQVSRVTGAGQESKNLTVNIDSFVKGGINTANTTLGKMDARELENWFNEMLMRTIRNLELSQ